MNFNSDILTTSENIEIEELNPQDIPENELGYFQEAQFVEVDANDENPDIKPIYSFNSKYLQTKQPQESEESQLQRFVNGEIAFPEFYCTLEEADEDDEWTQQDTKPQKPIIKSETIDYAQHSIPSTSRAMNSDEIINTTTVEISRRSYRKKSILPPQTLGLIGEANLRIARGQLETAEKICFEVIRQTPLACEPFLTLAQVYENYGEEEKFLEFLTIAAHLDPSNRDLWVRCAQINIEKGRYPQARICYAKAIRYLPKDYELRLMKIDLLEKIGVKHDLMRAKLHLIPYLPPEKHELCLNVAKEVANFFYQENRVHFALDAMTYAYKVVKDYFTTEDINLYLELLISVKRYDTALDILKDFTKMTYINEKNGTELSAIHCVFPDDMLPDFRVKACVCLIHLKAFNLLEYLMENIFEFILVNDTNGINWYMDIIESLMKEDRFEEALTILNHLVLKCDNNIQLPPYTWLRYAECKRALGNILEAIDAYKMVVQLAPFFYDAKFTLSALLKQQGRHKEAIKALEQNLDSSEFDPKVLYEYCLMLKQTEEVDQYVVGGYVLLARNSFKFESRNEIIAVSRGANAYKTQKLKSIIKWRLEINVNNEEDEKFLAKFNTNDKNFTIDEEFDLFKDLLQTCFEHRKYGMMEKLCFAILTTRKFRSKSLELEKYIVLSCFLNDDTLIAFMFLREIIVRNLGNQSLWILLNLLVQKHESMRYYRFLKRLGNRTNMNDNIIKKFLANYHLTAASYTRALENYIDIYKKNKDPLVALCIGVVFSQMATQKNSLKRPTAALHAATFIKSYSNSRLPSVLHQSPNNDTEMEIDEEESSETAQEVYYNLGRYYHQMNLSNYAIYYYNKALEVNNELIKKHENILDLTHEIAYNLHLVYKNSGNHIMARDILNKLIIV